MTIPQHIRDNHEATDAALIRCNGLICALEIVGGEIPEGAPKTSMPWQAFNALVNELVDSYDRIMRMRSFEWVGLGGNSSEFTDVEIAKARGELKSAVKA